MVPFILFVWFFGLCKDIRLIGIFLQEEIKENNDFLDAIMATDCIR